MNQKVGLYEVIKEASDVGFIAIPTDNPQKARVIRRAAKFGYLKGLPNSGTYQATVFGESFIVEEDFDSHKGKRNLFGFWKKLDYSSKVMFIVSVFGIMVAILLALL